MSPTLLAQATAAVDMATPFTLAVVVLLLGVAAAFGAMQMQASNMKEAIAALVKRIEDRERHNVEVDKALSRLTATMERVDSNLERLLNAQLQRTS